MSKQKIEIRSRFKKFGGGFIPDITEYLKDYISENPNVTISVGCDSIQKNRKTVYAVTIMMYNQDVQNGAHVVFFRDSLPKVKDNFQRLQKESEYVLDIGNLLQSELETFYIRKDLTQKERKRYKYHLLKCNGEYDHVKSNDEDTVIKNIKLSENEKIEEFKLIDLHLDFNPKEGSIDNRGYAKNKSHISYKTYVPWLRGLGFRVFSKNIAYAASSAADLLLHD